VFTYLGASILSIDSEWMAVFMAFLILLSLPVVRAIMVFILPLFYRLFGKKFILSSK
jgi:NhaP-type Na+/H+ or K+/H+ antiporter